jgi:isopentenyldiphosphate isomerase
MKIPIVDEEDNVIAHKDRKDRNTEDIRQVSALWVTAANGDVLLARRSFGKKNHPGVWGPAVSGTVEEGETYETNIIKEAEEEIGLKSLKFTQDRKLRRSNEHKYFVQWFTVVVEHDYPFIKNDEEVDEVRWFSKDEIIDLGSRLA